MFKYTGLPLFFISLFSFTALGQTVITDDNWVSVPGVNDIIYAFAVDKSGKLYAGGIFTNAGGMSVGHVASWDGSAWSSLGSGTTGGVNALLVDSSGNLYAGGSFDSAGGISANNIACWDGNAWSALGGGTKGQVFSLAFGDSNYLYAGGWFDSAGGVKVNNIARWDGKSWSAVGIGIGGSEGDSVRALASESSGNVYAIDVRNYVYKWGGGKWDTLGYAYSNIYTLASDKLGNLYAGGSIISLIKETAPASAADGDIVHWDGVRWKGMGGGLKGLVTAVGVDNYGNVYAGGYNIDSTIAHGIARWDGSAWSALGSGLQRLFYTGNAVKAIIIDKSSNLYVGGMFAEAGGKPASNFAKCMLNGVPVNSSLIKAKKSTELPKIMGNKVFFSLAKQTSAQFKVFDCAGRLILQSSLAVLGAGNRVMNISPLSPGVYILDFRAGDQSFRGKFSITK